MLWVQKKDFPWQHVARFSTQGVIPQSGSANYCDCNSIRDTSSHTLQFSFWYWVALHASQFVSTCVGPLTHKCPMYSKMPSRSCSSLSSFRPPPGQLRFTPVKLGIGPRDGPSLFKARIICPEPGMRRESRWFVVSVQRLVNCGPERGDGLLLIRVKWSWVSQSAIKRVLSCDHWFRN
jgi:hypothetical protein